MKSLFLFSGVLFLLSACGTSEPTLNPTQGVQMLAGTYTTTITADDLEAFETLDDLSGNQGKWVLVLTEVGEFTAELDGQYIAQGTYTVRGDELEVYIRSVANDDSGCKQTIGRYIWLLEEDQLLLAQSAGMCAAMDVVLSAHSLTRQP